MEGRGGLYFGASAQQRHRRQDLPHFDQSFQCLHSPGPGAGVGATNPGSSGVVPGTHDSHGRSLHLCDSLFPFSAPPIQTLYFIPSPQLFEQVSHSPHIEHPCSTHAGDPTGSPTGGGTHLSHGGRLHGIVFVSPSPMPPLHHLCIWPVPQVTEQSPHSVHLHGVGLGGHLVGGGGVGHSSQ